MASHAIFQYNVLAIDDTHNYWTNICVKMIIIRLIGPSDEKIQNWREANYIHRCNEFREDSVSRVHRMNRRGAE